MKNRKIMITKESNMTFDRQLQQCNVRQKAVWQKIIMKPNYRWATQSAVDELARDLNLRNEPYMQDWAYEIATAENIDKYLSYYQKTIDEDKKFVLMQMIIQATEEQKVENFFKYLDIIKQILQKDYALHEYTIYYWCNFDEDENLDDSWRVSSLMRELWRDKT